MIEKRETKRRKYFYFIFFILTFNIISIFLFPDISFNVKNYEKVTDDPNSLLQTSSSGPPNKRFFQYYKEIIIDHNQVSGTGSHMNFPVLISLLDSDLHDDVQSNGNDIAFANDTAWLDHEIEIFNQTYDGTHAQLIAWVRIPKLYTSIDTVIRMYYGNSTMGSQENPEAVWSSNYKGVWHLSETSGSALDSTSYSTTGSVSGTVSRDSPGRIASAYNFGYNGGINFGDAPDGHFDMGTGSFTISFWLDIEASTVNYQLPLHKGSTTDSEVGYDFETNPDAESLSFRITDGTGVIGSPYLDIDLSNWMYITGVVDRTSNKIQLFKNGQQVGSGTSISGVGNLNNDIPLKAPYYTYYLDGYLDELRISKTVHSADWIETEFNNQDDPISFYSIGKEYIVSGIPPNEPYFKYYGW
jgi:hypothetical protein